MQDETEVNYRYEVRFPLAEVYGVEHVLNLISAAGYSQLYIEPTKIEPSIFARWADSGEQTKNQSVVDEQEKRSGDLNALASLTIKKQSAQKLYKQIFLIDQNVYLLHQLVKAFVDQKLKFWDWNNGKIINPSDALKFEQVLAAAPSTTRATYSMLMAPETISLPSISPAYQTIYLWATNYQITKSDLFNFCKSLHIRIVFEQIPSQDVHADMESHGNLNELTNLREVDQTVLNLNSVLPWNTVDVSDPAPKHDWYTAARYFARQLVKEDARLLNKKSLLAEKVSALMDTNGIKKRGGIKPFDSGTILKSFSNVILK